ncbi:MAG: class I SAM-dependent methyltransferase [Legionellales bacterium]|nr:class I SAM-dependent methyltransferase [Legionellales bacterium]
MNTIVRKNYKNKFNLDFLNTIAKKKVLLAAKRAGIEIVENGDLHSVDKQNEKLTLQVNNDVFYTKILLFGINGAAIEYINNNWSTNDLVGLMRLVLNNHEIFNSIENGYKYLLYLPRKIKYLLERNSIKQAKKNIQAHYDLSNDFYQLFLDRHMMYSCAVFGEEYSNIDDASVNKMKIICQNLDINKHTHILEIGTGWGGMAVYIAKTYGCKITTTTISKEQYKYVKNLIELNNLTDQIELLNLDYRYLKGKYDAIISIEMIEAVGHKYMPKYFEICSSLLKKRGKLFLQAITMKDQFYDYSRKKLDFIKSMIFPGSCLPSINSL